MAPGRHVPVVTWQWMEGDTGPAPSHDVHHMESAKHLDARRKRQLSLTASPDPQSSLPQRLSAASWSDLQSSGYSVRGLLSQSSQNDSPSPHQFGEGAFQHPEHTVSSSSPGCASHVSQHDHYQYQRPHQYQHQHSRINHSAAVVSDEAPVDDGLHSWVKGTTTPLDDYIQRLQEHKSVDLPSTPHETAGIVSPHVENGENGHVASTEVRSFRMPSLETRISQQLQVDGSRTHATANLCTYSNPDNVEGGGTPLHHATTHWSTKAVGSSSQSTRTNATPFTASSFSSGGTPDTRSSSSPSGSGSSPSTSENLCRSASLGGSPSLTSGSPSTERLAVSVVPRRIPKRSLSPGSVVKHQYMQDDPGDPGKIQGLNLVWAAQARPRKRLNDEEKAQRKKKKETGTCPRCKKLKRVCEGFKESMYLPCVYCMISKPKSITDTCQLVANLLDIDFFRLGPATDNSSHPLNFFTHRDTVFNVTSDPLAETLHIELTQDVGVPLRLMVSRFEPQANDKLAYEGNTHGVPYRLEMPPYCIGDIDAAQRSVVRYMMQAKGAYFRTFLDQSNVLLRRTFDIICKRPLNSLCHKAMDIWAATRLIERTWKLCGTETFGIHPFNRASDPWTGHVPVTPIMDQQLDQVVIQKVLRPRRDHLLQELRDRMYSDDLRRSSMFDIYLTLFILLNNSEMHLAAEREFALRYGFGGRYGPPGKYKDAQAQFHAARTMLGHFHYICRANDIFGMSRDYLSTSLLLSNDEIQYLLWLRSYVKSEKSSMALIRQQDQYEATGYWFHQMFDQRWDPGTGYIEEIVEG